MQKEMDALTSLLHDMKKETRNDFCYTVGTLADATLVLHQCGIGKVNAAVGAAELIRHYHPDYLISSGVAGGIDDLAQVMNVVASDTLVYHDFYIGEAAEDDMLRPYTADSYLLDKARRLSLVSDTPIHIGQICTGDQFITDRPTLEDIKRRYPDGLAVDMESCAIAHTCRIYDTPFISFRIISDTIGAQQHIEEYENFWADMASRSFHVVRSYLESITQKQ